jgi:cell division septal protein FtsQ
LFLVVSLVFLYGLWQGPFRIRTVTVYGADESLAHVATQAMRGTYFGLVPRDSTLFFPAADIYRAVNSEYPDVATVSLFRSGLTGLSMKVDYRVPIARWSDITSLDPVASSTEAVIGEVPEYVFDASGFIYATTSVGMELVNPFIIHEPLPDGARARDPIGVTLPRAEKFPAVFDFAREVATLGAPVREISFRADEVDLYLATSTRITYVLGNEESAFTALVSARGSLDLTDGSVAYIDLRFPGKVYVKRRDALEP